MQRRTLNLKLVTIATLAMAAVVVLADDQEGGLPAGTAFTYQGRLTLSGEPVDGMVNLEFSLWNAEDGGTQICDPIPFIDEQISNGFFSVMIDFGDGCFNGRARWVEITVGGTPLSPRQRITPAPIALSLPGLYTLDNEVSPNIIGGWHHNSVNPGGVGQTISGGGNKSELNQITNSYGTIGGGRSNVILEDGATISGGFQNTASSFFGTICGGEGNSVEDSHSAIGGGRNNTILAIQGTISGGQGNTIGFEAPGATIGGGLDNTANDGDATVAGGNANLASGDESTVGGGRLNIAGGENSTVAGGEFNEALGDFSAVPGGIDCEATGEVSFAFGNDAKAVHDGAVVWSDSGGFDLVSTLADQWSVRARGGVRFFTDNDHTMGCEIPAGGGCWSTISDREMKENFRAIDALGILERLGKIRIETWNYKSQDPSIRHIGPVGQDFYAAFGVGDDDRHISTIDADGVSLAAIQELYQIAQEKDSEIAALKRRLASLEELVAKLASQQKGGER